MSLYESMKPGAIGIKKYPDEEDLKPYFYQDHCDRYDYLAAAACGAMIYSSAARRQTAHSRAGRTSRSTMLS